MNLLLILLVAFSFKYQRSVTGVQARIEAQNAEKQQVFETPASVVESDEDSDEKDDDFHPHEEDDDLNRGSLPRPVSETQAIDGQNPRPDGVDEDRGRPDDSISFISKAFTSRKTFSCPKTKADFVTGGNVATLNPEDIEIIAAMGDNTGTGEGLWPQTAIEFRGASFSIGGDASIDGLVTVPNILREFSDRQLIGVSHGMGSREELPSYQLNVAVGRSNTSMLTEQANELVRRMNNLTISNLRNKWTMIIVTIGTEEFCNNCAVPHIDRINEAMDILNRGIHKAFVVVIGPLHVSLASEQNKNLLKDKCTCLKTKTDSYFAQLLRAWEEGLLTVQEHSLDVKRRTFGVLVLPFLTITSRYPSSLFVGNTTLLNRRGHNYAAKWLWNRLISGPRYNLSDAILSRDKYFCPSVGCPYFRNHENFKYCPILRHVDATEEDVADLKKGKKPKRSQFTLYRLAGIVVGLAFCTATTGCIVFYLLSKHAKHGRFDMEPILEEGIYKEYTKPRGLTVVSKKGEAISDSEEEEETIVEPEYPYRRPEEQRPMHDPTLVGHNDNELENASFLNIGE
uniref:Lipase_GDSL domain-containing protein n=1 Tax=Panagrolaimus sp. JU765 TaxID=591449 RepID=A0AC34R5N3_9BILA